jgi:amidase
VRAPASHCGLYGIRPTHGRISLHAALELSPSFDTCGFFARDASTLARVAEVLLGEDPSDFPKAPRLLMPVDAWALLSRETRQAHEPALSLIQSRLGAVRSCEVSLESFDAPS